MDRKVSSTGTARMFLRGLAIQKGVLGALLMREIEIRWGRRNVGFAWVVLEPLIFALPVLGVWRLVRGPFEHGIPVIAFLWSGYLPILAFRHITGHAMYSIRQNSAVIKSTVDMGCSSLLRSRHLQLGQHLMSLSTSTSG